MGRQKLLMPFGDESIIDRVIRTVMSCEFEETIVVVSRETRALLSDVTGAVYLVNPNPDRGQDSSFCCALETLSHSSFAIFLADKPAVTITQIQELRRRFLSGAETALVPQREGVPGHPGFYTDLWRSRFLQSGETARSTLFRYANEVEWVSGYESCFFDVDTPEDYRQLQAKNFR
jgi:molybdenum cofactor cytidylyltransferase